MRIGSETFVLQDVAPGKERGYLVALHEEWAPVRERNGARFMGSYFLPKVEGRVISVWVTDPKGHAAMAKADDSKWRKQAQEWRTGWREELWIPI